MEEADETRPTVGGEVTEPVFLSIDEDLGNLEINEPTSQVVQKVGKGRRLDETRAQLAYALLGLVSLLLIMLLIMLWTGRLSANQFGNVAAVTVTPVIGLLGAATGYYYGKGKH